MIRPIAVSAVVGWLLFVVVISAAILFGRARASAQLVYDSWSNDEFILIVIDTAVNIDYALSPPRSISDYSVSPGGDYLAFLLNSPTTNDLMLWDTSILRNLSNTPNAIESVGLWSANGQLAFTSCLNIYGDCELMLWDRTTSYSLTDTIEASVGPYSYVWMDEQRLAFTACNDTSTACDVFLWDAETGPYSIASFDEFVTRLIANNNGELAFLVCKLEGYSICDIMVWDGETISNITNTYPLSEGRWLSWSSDGRLVFDGEIGDEPADIFVWDRAEVHNLSNTPDIFEGNPAWSLDGQLTFTARRCCSGQDVMLWDGVATHNLTNTPDYEESPGLWNADGQLAFTMCTDRYTCDLMLWDGMTVHNISNTPTTMETTYLWSNDGRMLVVRTCNIQQQTCEMLLWDGTTISDFSSISTADEIPIQWDTNGHLLFRACQRTYCDIMLWDGTTTTRLTNTLSIIDHFAAWLP